MRSGNWAAVAGLSVFALVAIACAAYLAASRQLDVNIVVAALAVLAIGQFVLTVSVWPRLGDLQARSTEQGKAMRDVAEQMAAAETRFTEQDQRISDSQSNVSAAFVEQIRVLRDDLAKLIRDMAKPAAAEPPPADAPQAKAEAAASAKPQQASPPRDHLDLLLEPIVELNSGATMHYRALLAMTGEGGMVIDHQALIQKAEAGGMRAAVEFHMLKQSLPVLRRLRLRHPNMRLMLPIGAAVLNSAADLNRFIAALEAESGMAQGIVFDLPQADLGHLENDGIEGLARLGRAGAVLALSDVSISGLDLASLRQLGVRYLGISAASLDTGFNASPAWKQFSQFARAMQFQLVATNVETAQQATAATRLARFGYGPFFAPPRRVKTDAGQSASAWAERAA